MNLIRYRHTRLDSIGADEFRFVLTDGVVESKEELFNIEISGQSSGEIHFHSVPIEVREGKDCLFPVLTIVPNQTTKEISIIWQAKIWSPQMARQTLAKSSLWFSIRQNQASLLKWTIWRIQSSSLPSWIWSPGALSTLTRPRMIGS